MIWFALAFLGLVFCDFFTSLVGLRILFRKRSNRFARAVAIKLTGFIIEQIGYLTAAIFFDTRGLVHAHAFLWIVLIARAVRSLTLWHLIWVLVLPPKGESE